jgi:hypothetical protein
MEKDLSMKKGKTIYYCIYWCIGEKNTSDVAIIEADSYDTAINKLDVLWSNGNIERGSVQNAGSFLVHSEEDWLIYTIIKAIMAMSCTPSDDLINLYRDNHFPIGGYQ